MPEPVTIHLGAGRTVEVLAHTRYQGTETYGYGANLEEYTVQIADQVVIGHWDSDGRHNTLVREDAVTESLRTLLVPLWEQARQSHGGDYWNVPFRVAIH